MNPSIVKVGFCCFSLSSAEDIACDRSEVLILLLPTVATRSPPATPPNVLEPTRSPLVKAMAITIRNASVMPTPNLDLKKLRKNWSIGGFLVGIGPAPYPRCGAPATLRRRFPRPGKWRFDNGGRAD